MNFRGNQPAEFIGSISLFLLLLFIICPLTGCLGEGGGTSAAGPTTASSSLPENYRVLLTGESASRSEIDPSGFRAEFKLSSDWKSGFGADITVTNLGSSRLNNWQLEFDFDRNITTIWNGSIVSHEGNHYVIKGESWNSWIEPGGSVSFGFNGSPGAVTVFPDGYKLTAELPAPPEDPGGGSGSGSAGIQYATTSDWGSGFVGSIVITNDGSTPISQWALEFDFDRNITGIWNAVVGSHDGDHYRLLPESYNGVIPPGGQVSLGFTGAPGNVSAGPVNYNLAINGGDPNPQPTPTPTPTPSPTPSPSPSPTPDPPPPESGRRVVGYFVQWGIYARNYLVTDIPADKVTHINYAFFAIDSSTKSCRMIDSWADIEKVFTGAQDKGFPDQTWDESARGEAGNLGRLKQLKAIYPGVKTMMSIGGWTLSYNFPDIAGTAGDRTAFVSSCMEMMRRYDFDGIDIDWEYPGSADKRNFTLLMEEFRRHLDTSGQADGKHYLLSFAGPAGYDKLLNLEIDRLAGCIDFVNIMNYDYHGGWDSRTNHHSPLYKNPDDPINPVDREILNTDWTVSYYIDAGMPAEKINMGVPFYGRAWEAVSANNMGLFQTSTRLPATNQPGNWEAGMLDYWKIQELLLNPLGYTRYWDDYAKVPWVYGRNLSGFATGGMFVTYEDPVSLSGKIQYLKTKGLGGVMFWELSGDIKDSDDPRSLLHVIGTELNN
ncbi:MAG: glycosyl hydrolase family 18 protein [Chloroflexi bacterium]|nr:glycosyl hydrolase family 18 protein [Chloroflexota bacterium]